MSNEERERKVPRRDDSNGTFNGPDLETPVTPDTNKTFCTDCLKRKQTSIFYIVIGVLVFGILVANNLIILPEIVISLDLLRKVTIIFMMGAGLFVTGLLVRAGYRGLRIYCNPNYNFNNSEWDGNNDTFLVIAFTAAFVVAITISTLVLWSLYNGAGAMLMCPDGQWNDWTSGCNVMG